LKHKKELKMSLKEIVTKLELIEGSLDDAFYSLPEYNANTDSRDYIDSARNELYCLKEDIEKQESNLPEIKYKDIEINGC
jgi:hypothetical protein